MERFGRGGRNNNWQLGDVTRTDKSTPTQIRVQGDSKIKYIEAGIYNSFAILENGDLYGWGTNFGTIINADLGQFEDVEIPEIF